MLVGAHVGATLGMAALVPARYRSSVDLRLLVACALLPDAIDKAIYLVAGRRLQRGALVGHSVLAALLVAVVAGPRRPAAWAYAGASAGHVVLDGLRDRPATLFWPLLGLAPEAWSTSPPSPLFPERRGRCAARTSAAPTSSASPHPRVGAERGRTVPVSPSPRRRGGRGVRSLGGRAVGLLQAYGQVLRGNAEQSLAELIGVALLLSLAHQWRLYRWRVFWVLLATGRVRPTLDLTGSRQRCGCS